ncbi:MAG TPA: AAA family ATPase [Candidatus Bathyarchaeia archaeon]|nr:AAA family ATPase [Candidatus Bathyarchaeia archaeon]
MCVNVKNMILTGCDCIDNGMGGGVSPETITLIYGEPETGKTTMAIQCAVNCAMQSLKTLFVDCDNTFSAKRLSQVSAGKFDEVAELIIVVKPIDFSEQAAIVDHLTDYIAKNFGLVVFDTFNSLYRAKVSETPGKAFGLNRELNRQMAILAQTAKIQHIPIVVTSQVKSVFNETYVSIAPVATRVLQFWADTVIALKPTENPTVIEAVLEKNRNTQEATCYLRIAETGIRDYKSRY